jgi:hypothetical protein
MTIHDWRIFTDFNINEGFLFIRLVFTGYLIMSSREAGRIDVVRQIEALCSAENAYSRHILAKVSFASFLARHFRVPYGVMTIHDWRMLHGTTDFNINEGLLNI